MMYISLEFHSIRSWNRDTNLYFRYNMYSIIWQYERNAILISSLQNVLHNKLSSLKNQIQPHPHNYKRKSKQKIMTIYNKRGRKGHFTNWTLTILFLAWVHIESIGTSFSNPQHLQSSVNLSLLHMEKKSSCRWFAS